MSTSQLLLHLPDTLLQRFRRDVPVRERSGFVRQLLEQALPPEDGDNDPLFLAAVALEQDTALSAEMAEWETATAGDGLGDVPPFQPRS